MISVESFESNPILTLSSSFTKAPDQTKKLLTSLDSGDTTLAEPIQQAISLNHQFIKEDIRGLQAEVTKLKAKKSPEELFASSSLEEIKQQLCLARDHGVPAKKELHLNAAKSYAKALLHKLDNAFAVRTQAISIIGDCITFNEPDIVMSKALTTLLDIIEALKKDRLTQEKLELYVESIYQKGLRLFGQKNNMEVIKDFLANENLEGFDGFGLSELTSADAS